MPERIIVTSALPYANGPIHFGHVVGAYLPADIYVRYGARPTLNEWDERPYYGGSNEAVWMPFPNPGVYHVMVRGYTAFSGVEVRSLLWK